MTDHVQSSSIHMSQKANNRLLRRRRAERRYRLYGATAIVVAAVALFTLIINLTAQGLSAFFQYEISMSVLLDEAIIDPKGTREEVTLKKANYTKLIQASLLDIVPEADSRKARRQLKQLMTSIGRFELRDIVLADPTLIGQEVTLTLPVSDEADAYYKGLIDISLPEGDRRLNDNQVVWLDRMVDQGLVERVFNKRFFVSGDSREPELAGIWGAVVGTFYTLLITLLLAFPLGVATAVYLEEFAKKNRWTDLIEVNINNLAAVPSIIFGLLGLAVFLNFFGMPRSAPVVGGFVLALMTLPRVIIPSRAALRAVPPSIREAALGVGASQVQTVFHHVVPLALPGMLTGAIIGMAQALGETAPLLMIGMVAFVADVPSGPLSPSTALPVQIFIWADSPERAFVAKTAGAILVLLTFLTFMNASAVLLRKRFERRW